MAILNDADLAYLRDQATKRGYNADDLLKVINYESKGDPTIWGGKGKNYFGLIQFGPEERAKFGVDTQHPSAQNQIDAAFKYLNARGFKPGMGLLDLYSTVNAGSPGHYNASDVPGMTVASHVAKMSGATPQAAPSQVTPAPPPFTTQPTPTAPASATTPAAALSMPAPDGMDGMDDNSLRELSADSEAAPQYDTAAIRGLLARLSQEQPAGNEPVRFPNPPAPSPLKRGRGLAFHQLTVKTPRFA